ncbi:hypothetical protein M0R04_04680 [Candidatus Dojkabacteria bacterium]|nr:hypothetical protein [Candidatus Dojkabacteria bacterium]
MITLTPAYGRDYKSKKAALLDIESNQDFILNDYSNPYNGKPCSPSDLSGQRVMVRYKNLTQVFVHTLK